MTSVQLHDEGVFIILNMSRTSSYRLAGVSVSEMEQKEMKWSGVKYKSGDNYSVLPSLSVHVEMSRSELHLLTYRQV